MPTSPPADADAPAGPLGPTSRAPATPVPPPPLWDGYCADPFVLRAEDGRYVMYGTTPSLPGGRAFQLLVSDDLASWSDAGGALTVPEGTPPGTEYWAPEVAHAGGRYWMYYSRGVGDTGHQLRVASSASPTGPFEDVGGPLTPDLPFAIDPSPYLDRTGRWWLFYADTQLSDKTWLRNVKVTELFYNPDGTIRTIDPFVRRE